MHWHPPGLCVCWAFAAGLASANLLTETQFIKHEHNNLAAEPARAATAIERTYDAQTGFYKRASENEMKKENKIKQQQPLVE